MNYISRLDSFFSNKSRNDKYILFSMPIILALFLIYTFEVSYVHKAQYVKKEQIKTLQTATDDISYFISNAPQNIQTLTAQSSIIKKEIIAKEMQLKLLNEKILISKIKKYSKERSGIVLAEIYTIASKYNTTITSSKALSPDVNKSGFIPNSKIILQVKSNSFVSLLGFIDKIEEINEPVTINSMEIKSDLSAAIYLDIWGHEN